MKKLLTIICVNCGNPFTSYPRYKKSGRVLPVYCSVECKSRAGRDIRICPQCGKEFYIIKSAVNEYCSKSCAHKKDKVDLICERCGKKYKKPPSQSTHSRFCSKECTRNRVTYTCEECGKKRTVPASSTAKRFCGNKCRLKWFSNHFRGENSPHWKGGEYPYYGPNWRQQRNKARYRDGHICQHCGKHQDSFSEKLSVAHIVPFREFGLKRYKEANALSNLITLCRKCHIAFDWSNGSRN